jgi:hypothetical protein
MPPKSENKKGESLRFHFVIPKQAVIVTLPYRWGITVDGDA